MIWEEDSFNKKENKRVQYPEINPSKFIVPDNITIEEIYSALGRKANSTINSLQPLIHFIKRYAAEDKISISQTAKPLISKYNSQPNVYRNIQRLIGLNILKKVDDKFKNGEYGLFYTININNLNLIYKDIYCDNSVLSISISDSSPENIDELNVHFGKIRKKDKVMNYDDFWVLEKMYKVYPQVLKYQKIAEYLNNQMSEDDKMLYGIQFEPKITRDKKGNVTNVSIRATSDFASMKSREKHPEFPWYIRCREDFLDKDLGDGWEEYDVKGSVPRLAHYIHTGEYLPEDTDPYEEMFKGNFFAWEKHTRDICKDWFMRIYFGGTIKNIVAKAISSNKYPGMKAENKEQITEDIAELKQSVDSYCGIADGNSIFLHESCIYLDVMKELMKRGIKVLQVYDGFFFKKGEVPSDMYNLIKQCTINYCNTYIHS